MKPNNILNRMASRVLLLLAGAILLSVLLVSLTVNLRFNQFFTRYLIDQQSYQVEQLLETVETLYEQNGGWSLEALNSLAGSPYIRNFDLVLRDTSGRILLTTIRDTGIRGMHQRMMGRMQGIIRTPGASDSYRTSVYELNHDGRLVGMLEIGIDGPFSPTERDLSFLDGINQSIWMAAVLALALAGFAGWILSRRMLSPLNRLALAAHDISRGILNPSFTIDSQVTEWQELAAALAGLSASLQAQESLRIRLTSDISHELRTPLSVLQSHLEAFEDGIWEPTPARLSICRQETERLTQMVVQLQQLASLESADSPLHPESFNLTQELENLCQSMHPSFEQKNIQFQWNLTGSIQIMADKEKVHRMTTNLLTNAMKYTNAGGQVTLRLQRLDQGTEIIVSDTGMGIAAKDLPHIFERFYRTDESRTRRSGGAGIGLAIVKSFAEAHGGHVAVESRMGKGTTFRVWLPL
ncbi:MAG: HAMP domain-containing sensor histidine kinase [Bacillota bacterium]|nr:HAMP domain-containing sensor histidine kinase [Bacillota bacterium]MDW7678365.1 HAMP domain-containing sensor histidine kinase [Bacillota bacterium]